jgi:4a-hydroxytetrahydrobiopterin dehydratase
VGDGGNLVAEPEGEEQLGGRGNEGDDAHEASQDMSLLSDDEIAGGLAGSPWERDGDAIAREIELADFAAAIALVNRVAEAAEAANHHPDILVHGWNKVRLQLSTHSEGGITQSDLDMARTLDGVI